MSLTRVILLVQRPFNFDRTKCHSREGWNLFKWIPTFSGMMRIGQYQRGALVGLLSFLVSSFTYALPCPNGQGIIYKGDSIEEVIGQCGQPYDRNSRTLVIETMQEWVYNKYLPYNSGYAQIIITFQNERVSNIHINTHTFGFLCRQQIVQLGALITTQTNCGDASYNVSSTDLCGWIVSVGDRIEVVQSTCGFPSYKNVLQINTVEYTELTYEPKQPTTIIFQNGKLTDWR